MQAFSRWTARGLFGTALVALSLVVPQVASADVTVEGPFYDLAGTTIDGTETYEVTVCPGAFWAHIGFEEVGVDYIWQFFIPPFAARGTGCDGGITEYVDTTLLSEGPHTFRGEINYEDYSDEFTVTIDR
ncbi:hypothetical protein OJ997_32140 [Solirubrobacter phytolaccae]|uniref:Uncharacterized protein n=1 Tax=Solirubrobacter phytolaccae TaxID=1404360 RepID=A0A9X3SAY4_9ACTN|nr:hypothetical protein [Solirubrobacter phytolaccae]MDA0184999.1 hypothetical protein [Solirubrobacter phytolaccae]